MGPLPYRRRLVYFIFDLLHLDGDDVGALPPIERKARLAALLSGVVPPRALVFLNLVLVEVRHRIESMKTSCYG